jgi:hypothetical protein
VRPNWAALTWATLDANGGSVTFVAPLLVPKSTDPVRIVALNILRSNRTRGVAARDEMSDIGPE